MRRLFEALPGPLPVRLLTIAIVLIALLVALGFLFEWAGTLLDDGGTIGV